MALGLSAPSTEEEHTIAAHHAPARQLFDEVDLAAHGRALECRPKEAAAPVLVSNARIVTMNTAAPEADAMLATGKTIGQVAQSLEISEQTFHRWRNQYGGMKAEEAKRLKELEQENARLKKLLAESQLDKEILQEALKGNY